MKKEYPLRLQKEDTIVFDCSCGHNELSHKTTLSDFLFRNNTMKPMFSGHCKICMCHKFEKTEEADG